MAVISYRDMHVYKGETICQKQGGLDCVVTAKLVAEKYTIDVPLANG